MTARRDSAPEDRAGHRDRDEARPDAEGDRRYGDRAADVRPVREPDPDVRGPQEGYDATADAARRTGAPGPDDRDSDAERGPERR
ncbi:hypothetical protein [Kitasatospora phosalacinea]|uniref:hypothetical protein n=1 Tax=Kitasatospora phosalacinea TaxID=2065 RepID=UPI00052464E0|nr:hypothetical protein [Kitasatospora phosalacinea]